MSAYSKEQQKIFHDRLQEVLDSEIGGFVIIFNAKTMKITDTYVNVCENCINNVIKQTINDAIKHNIIKKED